MAACTKTGEPGMTDVISVFEAARAKAAVGMEIAAVAGLDPDRSAVISEYGNLSFKQLNDRANQIAHMLRSRGFKRGDSIAILSGNRPEFIEVRFAAHRIGARLTTVNWHLVADEIAYIVDDCDAMALFADVRTAAGATLAIASAPGLQLSFAIGGAIAGFEDYAETLAPYPKKDIDAPVLGSFMQYTSGTTGRPKGVLRKQPDPAAAAEMQALLSAVFQFQPDSGTDKSLVAGPLYHSGPFNLSMTTPLSSGIGVVLMDKWEPEDTLQLIARHQITHSFFVPTMFMRMLQAGEDLRGKYDVSSLRFVIHGAAPCAIEIKRQMLDWFGPIIWEMFAGTEGPGTLVSPQEWLTKPGTVGKPGPGQMRILNETGEEVAPGIEGQIWLINPKDSMFEYYKASKKTAEAQRNGYFSAGDIGYIDADGYLFLTGRSAETIISGGVNIYPQEIDNVLLKHPKVADVACVGVPHPDLGEQVKAVVQLLAGETGNAGLARELMGFCQPHLAKQKWPRSIDFVDHISRSEAGKVYRRALRDSYWQLSETKI
jgi:long-chain acyl-CoA synthetase